MCTLQCYGVRLSRALGKFSFDDLFLLILLLVLNMLGPVLHCIGITLYKQEQMPRMPLLAPSLTVVEICNHTFTISELNVCRLQWLPPTTKQKKNSGAVKVWRTYRSFSKWVIVLHPPPTMEGIEGLQGGTVEFSEKIWRHQSGPGRGERWRRIEKTDREKIGKIWFPMVHRCALC